MKKDGWVKKDTYSYWNPKYGLIWRSFYERKSWYWRRRYKKNNAQVELTGGPYKTLREAKAEAEKKR